MNTFAPLTRCIPALDSEAQRLALLRSMALLDTPAETAFDAITQLAAQVTGRPIALISLVDAERTWFKSRVGLEATESPNDFSFCRVAIASDDLFEVPDAQVDPRFSNNPLVTGEPYLRYYAGMPLRVAGLPMGSVCVVDHVPYQLDASQRNALRHLGQLTVELLERRLASHAKTEFIGHMNHEMRTPMNAILGFGQLLQLEVRPGSREATHVRQIVEAGHHLLELIDESLDLMRVEAGDMQLELQPIDLVPMLTDVAALLRPVADRHQITLHLELPHALCARGDPRRTQQVMLNLASNAIKYGRDGSQIHLSAGTADDGSSWAAVKDDGAGLTPEEIDRLFKPFERPAHERGHVQSTGLGLALSVRLIEAMGGHLQVSSEVGQGTMFTVTWPPCDPAQASPAEPVPPRPH